VTTRVPELLARSGTAVPVDQMSVKQSRRLLSYELPPLNAAVADRLLEASGRWPLLLRLANKMLAGHSLPTAVKTKSLISRLNFAWYSRARPGKKVVVGRNGKLRYVACGFLEIGRQIVTSFSYDNHHIWSEESQAICFLHCFPILLQFEIVPIFT